jgi:hypothetical protein
MNDEDAYMALVLRNSQPKLHSLEAGWHALNSGLDVKAHASNRPARASVQTRVNAATVATVTDVGHKDLRARPLELSREVHAAPNGCGPRRRVGREALDAQEDAQGGCACHALKAAVRIIPQRRSRLAAIGSGLIQIAPSRSCAILPLTLL